jgi:hypothetical protein
LRKCAELHLMQHLTRTVIAGRYGKGCSGPRCLPDRVVATRR